MNKERLSEFAFSFLPKTTPKERAEWLEAHGTASAFFNPETEGDSKRAFILSRPDILRTIESKASDSLKTIRQNNLKPLFLTDDAYPSRLKECVDAPTLLYQKGECDLNAGKILSVVGTRKATPYGKDLTNELVQKLAQDYPDLIIVSGLAYGVDIIAHQAALKANLRTVAVLAHGLQEVYPKSHGTIARQIVDEGGCLITEHSWGVPSMKHQFLERNRIVAGMCDACLIIESGESGGSMTTARLARDYNREVMAFPGRIYDKQSRGCNKLIRNNVASLIESADDIAQLLGWEKPVQTATQKTLFEPLDLLQQQLLGIIGEAESLDTNQLGELSNIEMSALLSTLLELELSGFIESMPGGKYRRIRLQN